jgi:hypothetical protein
MHAAISDEQDSAVKADYAARRARILASPSGLGFRPHKESVLDVAPREREAAFEKAWNGAGFGFALTFRDILLDEQANATAADFIRTKIAGIVEDPEIRELLTPRDHPFGAKRTSCSSIRRSPRRSSCRYPTRTWVRPERRSSCADRVSMATRTS